MYPIKKVEVDLKSAHHGTSLLGRIHVIAFVAIQSLSHAQLFAILWTAAREAPLSSTISRSLLRFRCIESVMLSNHLSSRRSKGEALGNLSFSKFRLDSITDSIDMNLSKLREIVEDRGAWQATVHGVTKSQT